MNIIRSFLSLLLGKPQPEIDIAVHGNVVRAKVLNEKPCTVPGDKPQIMYHVQYYLPGDPVPRSKWIVPEFTQFIAVENSKSS